MKISKISEWFIFFTICSIYLFLTFLFDNFIISEQIYYRSLSDKLTYKSLESFLEKKQQFWWIIYLVTPVITLLKITFAVICICIGAVLSTIEFKFKTIFKAAVFAELVFIGAQILYLISISFHLDTLTLETAANYYPLSVLGWIGTENVVSWLHYPLQTLNLFEVFYMAAIAWLLARQWKPDFTESLSIVLPSYGTGLILWLALVTFLTLQVS